MVVPWLVGCLSATDLEPLSQQLTIIERSVDDLSSMTPQRSDLAAEHAALQQQLQIAAEQAVDDAASLDTLLAAVEGLERELAVSNARIDVLARQITEATTELEAVRSAAVQAQRQVAAIAPDDDYGPIPDNPRLAYDRAYNAYVEGELQRAVEGFERFLDQYPGHELADNATYWLGESHYRRNDFRRAIERFDEVLSHYERSERVASSALKRAYALLELGQRASGIEELQAVKCKYTGTDEAALASSRLSDLGVDATC